MMLPKGCLVPFSQMAGKGRPIVEQRAKTVLPKQSVAAIQTHFHVYFEMWWDHSSPPPKKNHRFIQGKNSVKPGKINNESHSRITNIQ